MIIQTNSWKMLTNSWKCKQKADRCKQTAEMYEIIVSVEDNLVANKDGSVTCLACGKSLAHKKSAKRHYMIKHLDNQPVWCNICQQTFKNALSLETHQRIFHDQRQQQLQSGTNENIWKQCIIILSTLLNKR